eukprot:scaffold707_cov399-Prasinococcus_capsulatus_cf.AAC.31
MISTKKSTISRFGLSSIIKSPEIMFYSTPQHRQHRVAHCHPGRHQAVHHNSARGIPDEAELAKTHRRPQAQAHAAYHHSIVTCYVLQILVVSDLQVSKHVCQNWILRVSNRREQPSTAQNRHICKFPPHEQFTFLAVDSIIATSDQSEIGQQHVSNQHSMRYMNTWVQLDRPGLFVNRRPLVSDRHGIPSALMSCGLLSMKISSNTTVKVSPSPFATDSGGHR